ncbi:MAG: DUF2335 domain-containing protein [candidate division Zixibacteria bacterium]|nr:DUF2335 domain-containing protein [Candidatus Tariuqbacter arcticus]
MPEKNKNKKPSQAEPESQNLPDNVSSEKPKPNSHLGISPDEISAIIKKDGTVVGLDGEVKENYEISRQFTIARSAPLPPPQEFEGFERVLPGSAERILKMAEAQQSHRHHMEEGSLSIERVRLEASIQDNEHTHTLKKKRSMVRLNNRYYINTRRFIIWTYELSNRWSCDNYLLPHWISGCFRHWQKTEKC